MSEEPKQTRWHTDPELWRKLKPLAREKRHKPTPAEYLLWQRLRDRRIGGVKFRRQYTVERFIADFFSIEARLVIEVDGPIHDYTPEEDAIRQAFIESLGLRVLRFTNDEVIGNVESVIERIQAAL